SMFLQRIDLNGFKSFANATTLEFLPPTHASRGITAIVGPNGSGKSCVVDAIRWVLGEQSMKLLRGKKSEDVIFAGTPKRPRLGVAEVTLILNNEDGGVPIDFREVAIGRRVYRSGESEYILNGTQVRREDIQILLAKARVGQRTYSIIGQGMVDEFLLATPAQRKGFFDEAAGIRPAELKRDAALRKLERAAENLHQGEVLLQELTPRLRSLSRQVQRLARKEEVERELQTLLEQYYGARWHELAAAMDASRAKHGTADQQRVALQRSVDGVQQQLAELEKQEKQDDAFLPLQREYESFMEQRQHLRERVLSLTHELQRRAAASREVLPASALTTDLDAALREFAPILEALGTLDSLTHLPTIIEKLHQLHERIASVRRRASPDAPAAPPELMEAERDLKRIEGATKETQQRMQALHEQERQQKGALFDLQRQYRAQQLTLNQASGRANDARIELARLEQRREDLLAEMTRAFGAQRDPATLAKPDAALPTDARLRIERLQRDIAAIGSLDEETMREHEETKQRVEFLEGQTEDLRKSMHALERVIDELAIDIDRAFHAAFQTINEHFERYFRILFGGGQAKLTLLREVTQEEPDEDVPEGDAIPDVPPADRPRTAHDTRRTTVSGIDIAATPPGKRIKSISMLSGGERALTAIALLCAIISSSKSPFVVLDEVDAALDESNSVRFAEILKDLSRETQFLVVTHNRYSMERAAAIYGITMAGDGASKLLSMKLEEAKEMAA
ncbi:MAG: AAA family ATPase, partial [bacterium]|nr:AAA family ATPase [bacterium]